MEKCNKETEIALIHKTNSDMVEKIKKIEEDVSTLTYNYHNIKDILGTIKLTMSADNSDIVSKIEIGNKEIVAILGKELAQNRKDIKEWADNKFEHKEKAELTNYKIGKINKVMWLILGAIITSTVGAIFMGVYYLIKIV